MANIEIGDLVEIQTALGISYAQYTHEDLLYGSIVRVFNTIYKKQPIDLAEVVKDTTGFSVYFPLDVSLEYKAFRLVGNYSVPSELSEFPLFRCGGVGASGKVKTWWLWDGHEEVRIDKLTEAQKSLPVRTTWSIDSMLLRIESRWSWDMDPHI